MNDYTLRKDFPLTSEQNEVLDFMLSKTKCINGCQTGFGKTYVGCTGVTHILLKYPDTRVIILCPQKAVKAFRRELTEKLRIQYNELTSSKKQVNPNCRITIMTHTSLKNNIEYIQQLKEQGNRLILLVDEAHVLQSPKSKLYQLVASIRQYFSVCWFMTATPLKNNIEGLYWMFHILDPRIFGNYAMFEQKYIVTQTRQIRRKVGKGEHKRTMMQQIKEIVGYKNLDNLQEVLANYIIIKQKHYNLEFHYHNVELKPRELEPYMRASDGLARETSEDNFAVRLHDLQKVVDNIDPEYRVEKSLSSKEELFLNLVLKKMKEGHPTLVYCDYTEVVERLEMLLKLDFCKKNGVKKIFKVTGNIPQKQREKVEELITPGTVVLITSAGTESINLQKADSMIFYDTPFSCLSFIQAVGRITRMDSKFSKQYVHILANTGTIDDYKKALIQINGALIQAIFGNMETLPLDIINSDRSLIRELKQKLLWCSREGKLIDSSELDKLMKKLSGGN